MDESMLSDTQAASGEGITPLATLELPGPSRLLSNSCCPDKDLAVVIVQSDGKEKLSLWKLQGSKKWEVDVAAEGVLEHRIVAIAWSPDSAYPGFASASGLNFRSAQSIAVAHHPTRVTLHSIQDGREERVLNLKTPPDNLSLTSLWWFEHAKSKVADVVPDIFKRQGIIVREA
jgi:anaphase-promoting complex subunit 4